MFGLVGMVNGNLIVVGVLSFGVLFGMMMVNGNVVI